jgi:Subtilase family/Ricin-type beta-trefoil lectin domain-like
MFKRFHILAILGSLALAGCGTSSLPITDHASKPTGYLVTLNVTDGSSQAALEQRYGGTTLAFDAQSGFAMLHTSQAPAKNDPAVKSVQEDSESLAPDIKKDGTNEVDLNGNTSSATGSTSWSSGWNVWGSGSSAWGSGTTSWGSGTTSWGSGSTSWGSGTVVPALPIENQSAWNQINLYEAHRLSRNFGGGIKVAVIDSGIDLSHPVFAGKLSNAAEFWDYVGKDATPQDEAGGSIYGHGTAVAGIILQVAPRATILPIRVLRSDGTANTSDVVAAISRAVNNGANVINLSLGTGGYDQSLMDICAWANGRGVRIVAAAGNNGQKDNMDSPARFGWETSIEGWTVGVGSVNANDQRSSFSSYGDDLYVFAPGENIWSAYPGNKSATFTGTSFAAPIYTGALALGLSEMPIAQRATIHNALWGATYAGPGMDWGASKFTATDGSTMGGRLNLEKFVRNLPGWTVPSNLQAGVYKVANLNSNKCLDVYGWFTNNNAAVVQWDCANNNDNQKWRIEPVGGGLYKLLAMHSGKALTIGNNTMTSGEKTIQWDYLNEGGQKWKIEASGGGYRFVASHSNQCLEVLTASGTDGAQVQQSVCNGTPAQQFKLKAQF